MTTAIREKCEGCGMCCRAIHVGSLGEYERSEMMRNRGAERRVYEFGTVPKHNDIQFAKENWYPLTREEVEKRNPFLVDTVRKRLAELCSDESADYKERRLNEMLNTEYYACNQLDESTGRCMTHDDLPHVCAGYPWYGRDPNPDEPFYTADCFYKNDII